MSLADVRFAARCERVHKQAAGNWSNGRVVKVWKDKSNILCIVYESGNWWHYRSIGNGIEWW